MSWTAAKADEDEEQREEEKIVSGVTCRNGML